MVSQAHEAEILVSSRSVALRSITKASAWKCEKGVSPTEVKMRTCGGLLQRSILDTSRETVSGATGKVPRAAATHMLGTWNSKGKRKSTRIHSVETERALR